MKISMKNDIGLVELTPKVSLGCALHDPEARVLEVLKRHIKELKQVYNDLVAASVTDLTSSRTISALKSEKLRYAVQDKKSGTAVGDNYRQSLELALDFNTSHVHIVDCDRVLHWVRRFPDELKQAVQNTTSYKGFVFFARTRRAFESHPVMQKTTESTVNAIASEVAGMDLDIMSGAFAMDRETARLILKESKRKDFGVYAEFLEIVMKHKISVHAIEVDGLEWETPDQYMDKIEKEGYLAWLDEFESLPQWQKRVKIIQSSADILTKEEKKLKS